MGADEVIGGIHVGFKSVIELGLGLAIKWYPVPLVSGDQETANLKDVGSLLSVRAYQNNDYLATARFGFSYMNIGDAVFDPALGNVDISERRRWGISTEFRAHSLVDLPISASRAITFAFNFDVETESGTKEDRTGYYSGAEIGVVDAIFIRAGYVDGARAQNAKNASFGLGLGAAVGAFRARADYARWPIYRDAYIDVFGLSFGLTI
jgi:hypothetical protein